MPIREYTDPPEPFQAVTWTGTQQDLADITQLLGWTPTINNDGTLHVLLPDGSMQPVHAGWAVTLRADGHRGVAAADVAARWIPAG